MRNNFLIVFLVFFVRCGSSLPEQNVNQDEESIKLESTLNKVDSLEVLNNIKSYQFLAKGDSLYNLYTTEFSYEDRLLHLNDSSLNLVCFALWSISDSLPADSVFQIIMEYSNDSRRVGLSSGSGLYYDEPIANVLMLHLVNDTTFFSKSQREVLLVLRINNR